MKWISQRLFLCSLTITVTGLAYAEPEQVVNLPVLEGGLTGSVGALYIAPSSDFQTYHSVIEQPDGVGGPLHFTNHNITPDYQLGIDASLGYIFEDTANAIELYFRNINTSDSDSTTFTDVSDGNGGTISGDSQGDLGYELNSFDLLISQFLDIGTNMQMRFTGGLAYVELEQTRTTILNETGDTNHTGLLSDQTSQFTGWGPRIGIDGRYDFGQGFGIVGGGSMAYYLGDLDLHLDYIGNEPKDKHNTSEDHLDSHAVMNFRANLGVDYVYFFSNEERSTLGLELGYLIDYYNDGIATSNISGSGVISEPSYTTAVSFSGPYINLKGVF